MTVNEAVLALLRPKPDQLANEPADVLAAAQAAVDAPAGLGTIASYATEVALPATGTWSNPGKGGAQADIVITAPEDGVPLLFVEIDNCFEPAQELAAKIDKRFCQRKVKDVDGKERPMWRTRWWAPDGRHGDQPHPPLLLVFNHIGPRNPNTVIAQLAKLTRRHWQGTAYEDGFHMYDGKLPIVVTSMNKLKEHGPAGAIFQRFGRPHNQTLLEAIGNPRREAHDARQRAEYAARECAVKEQLRRAAEQQRAECEARRPLSLVISAFSRAIWGLVGAGVFVGILRILQASLELVAEWGFVASGPRHMPTSGRSAVGVPERTSPCGAPQGLGVRRAPAAETADEGRELPGTDAWLPHPLPFSRDTRTTSAAMRPGVADAAQIQCRERRYRDGDGLCKPCASACESFSSHA
ncbi:hypothetical protein ACIG0D_31275 [Streptomyces sp. NPDC052773]|uniref:hypothetical protein n=1 Tax=Streptomyces sp. NPDC052773 TaxID=3365693 RepID=UPI0037D5DF4A